jgi:hypothetical protein
MKTGEKSGMTMALAAVFGLALLAIAGMYVTNTGLFASAAGVPALPGQPSGGATTGLCPNMAGQSTALVTNFVDKYKPATVVSATGSVYLNGESAPRSITSNATAVTPGISYQGMVSASNYYNQKVAGAVNCQPSDSISGKLGKKSDVAVDNVINSDGITANGVSATQTIGANTQRTVHIILHPSTADGFITNPSLGYGYLLVGGNTSFFDFNNFGLTGPGISAQLIAGAPGVFSGTYNYAFKVTYSDMNQVPVSGSTQDLYLKVASLNAANAANNLTWVFLDADVYQNSLTGAVSDGVVNDNGADIGQTGVSTQTIYTA